MERKEVGMGKNKRLERKYTMEQLLHPEFRLPHEGQQSGGDPVAALKRSKGVKVFKVDN